jgi:hypothetical protein
VLPTVQRSLLIFSTPSVGAVVVIHAVGGQPQPIE